MFSFVLSRVGFRVKRWAEIREEKILPCLGVERYVPRFTFLIRRPVFFLTLSFCRLHAISSRDSIENRFSREYLSEIRFMSNLPLPPPCSRRSICRSGRRSRADNRTCWWSWSGRLWISCSKRVLRSRCLTHISLLSFCASRSLLLPLLSLLPCAQWVPSSSRHFFFITGYFIPSRRQAIPRRADRWVAPTCLCFKSAPSNPTLSIFALV